jgi:hypothetical protein
MLKLKSIIFLLVITFLMASCDLNNDSYNSFTGYVNVDDTQLADSAFSGQTVPISVHANALSGCWSGLKIYLEKSLVSDTLFSIVATGNYESYNGICAEIIVSTDTVFQFKADSAGTYIFTSYSSSLYPKSDTLFVTDSLPGKK